MARGFSATGVGSTDRITPVFTGLANVTQRSWALWTWKDSTDAIVTAASIFNLANASNVQIERMQRDQAANKYQYVRDWSTTVGVWTVDTIPSDDAWHHWLITYDGGSTANDPIVYLDGSSTSVTATRPAGTLTTNGTQFFIGNRQDSTRVWRGMIAELACWNRILTAAEAKALAIGYSPLFFPTSLKFYAPLLRANWASNGTFTTVTGTAVQDHPPQVIYPRRGYAGA